MIVSWSVNLLKLACECTASATVGWTVRRMERFPLRTAIRQHEAPHSIIAALPVKGRFILTMDGTSWKLGKFKYYILAVGICFNGVSLPICFAFLPDRDITSFVDEISIMESVVSLIGNGRIECLLADREFGNGNFAKWLQINRIRYCLRLRENLYMRKDGQKRGRMLRDVLSSLRIGESVALHDAWLMRKNTIVRIYATRCIGRGGEDSMIILASPLECDYTAGLYRKKMDTGDCFPRIEVRRVQHGGHPILVKGVSETCLHC